MLTFEAGALNSAPATIARALYAPAFVSLGCSRDFDRQAQGHDNERLPAIRADDEEVALDEPVVKLRKTGRPDFDFDDAIDALQRNRQVAEVRTARRTRERDTLSREACRLESSH